MLKIFATGGTFDKVYFDANSAFSVGEPQAIPLLQEANLTIPYSVESLVKKDSLEMTDQDRAAVDSAVRQCEEQHIVIIHGTDTLVATAKALQQSSIEGKTIVFVGAMQPARMRYSDAAFNLGFAVAATQLLAAGIYVAMNGQVFPYDRVQKNIQQGLFERI